MDKKMLTMLFVAFLVGTFWGDSILNSIYFKLKSYTSKISGENVVVVDQDYVRVQLVDDTMYVYLDIDKPIKTTLEVPLNATMNYLYNISEYQDITVSGSPNDFAIIISHKKPIVP